MQQHKTHSLLQSILSLRAWEDKHLPLKQSALAYDLLILVVHNELSGTPISLKQLFVTLKYSEAGIRKQLRRLLKEEWIKLQGIKDDKRVRVVIAQPKLLDAMTSYVSVFELITRIN